MIKKAMLVKRQVETIDPVQEAFSMKPLGTGMPYVFIILAFSAAVHAHVPYIETEDYSEAHPFFIDDSIEYSKAVYAWFDSVTDSDIYAFEVQEPVRVYAKALVQVCEQYKDLLPWMAVAGPGLDPPDEDLPFLLPEGYGAVVIKNKNPGEPRETFFEVFSGKRYYDGPVFDREVTAPGVWYVCYWDPYLQGGDYVAVLGFRESFSPADIVRALIITPKIWLNRHLHVRCP